MRHWRNSTREFVKFEETLKEGKQQFQCLKKKVIKVPLWKSSMMMIILLKILILRVFHLPQQDLQSFVRLGRYEAEKRPKSFENIISE